MKGALLARRHSICNRIIALPMIVDKYSSNEHASLPDEQSNANLIVDVKVLREMRTVSGRSCSLQIS
jgi:hypothetical protein